MVKRIMAWLALAAALVAFPASAAPPSATAQADQQFRAFGAWMERVAAAMVPMNEAGARFGADMQKMPPPADDPAERARQIAQIRAMIADVRRSVEESRSRLAEIPSFEGEVPGVRNANINRLLAEARGQVDRMYAYMDDTEAFAAAAARGDPAASQQAGKKLIRGGFLLIDSQAILYRGRQSLFPPDRSAHQLVGVGVQLYRSMQVAAEAWYQARIEGVAEGAALTQRTRFLELADELESILREGRANLARERNLFASQKPAAARDPSLARILARVEGASKSYVETFALGDEIVAWLRARAGTPGSVLVAQDGPELILARSAFEQRLVASGAAAAAVIAEP